MKVLEFIYKTFRKPIPYYAKYPFWLIVWKPIRKYLNVVIIPNIPFTRVRVILYRLLGFRIGRKVFIGMKCYLDDVCPSKTIIEDNVTISYGTYFACHGRWGWKKWGHTTIRIKENAYIGMRCIILSGENGVTIGMNSVIGAGSTVNKSIPDNVIAAGCPAKIIKCVSDKDVSRNT